MIRSIFVALLALALIGAGCLGTGTPTPTKTPVSDAARPVVDGLAVSLVNTTAGPMQARAASGAISRFVLPADASVELPSNVFVYDLQKKWFTNARTVAAKAGQEFDLLVPPGMTNLTLNVKGADVVVATPYTGTGLFQTHNIISWYKTLRDQYPNRCAGCPNYAKSQQYFAGLFKQFGITTVDVDPFGMNAAGQPTMANVVAYRYAKTDVMHPLYLGVGGHYDVVTGTREGAFDNTAGTLATLEMAQALANMTPTHNLIFGLWGGEESGLRGSAFFTKTNPQIAAQMGLYVNLDVVGFSWPDPAPVARDNSTPDCKTRPTQTATSPFYCPDPVIVSAGPDGPVADHLFTLGKRLQQKVAVGWPDDYFIYEGIAQGQAQGYAKVNAQSDHSSFMAAGVPVYFLFNGDALKNPITIHNQKDTLANWTKYMVYNYPMVFDNELTPEEVARGEALIEQSFLTYLWLTFYSFLFVDLGIYNIATGM